jgi:hypothetical protein
MNRETEDKIIEIKKDVFDRSDETNIRIRPKNKDRDVKQKYLKYKKKYYMLKQLINNKLNI